PSLGVSLIIHFDDMNEYTLNAKLGNDVVQRLQAGGVHEGDVSQAYDHHTWCFRPALQNLRKALYRSKEKRPFNHIDANIRRQLTEPFSRQFTLQFRFILPAYHHAFRHVQKEVQHGENHADVYRNDQINEDGDEEGDHQNDDISPRGTTNHANNMAYVAHIPGHHKQNGGKG